MSEVTAACGRQLKNGRRQDVKAKPYCILSPEGLDEVIRSCRTGAKSAWCMFDANMDCHEKAQKELDARLKALGITLGE